MTAADRHAIRAAQAYRRAVQCAADGDDRAATVWLSAAEAAMRLADKWQARANAAQAVTP